MRNLLNKLKEYKYRNEALLVFYLAAITTVVIYRPDTIWFFVIGVGIMIPLEFIFRRHKMTTFHKSMFTDTLHVTIDPVLSMVPIALVYSVLEPLQITSASTAIASQPRWLQILEAFLFKGLFGYWQHRLAHEIPLLWRLHAVHHSPSQLNWISGERRHPFDSVWGSTFTAIPMVLTGFNLIDLGYLAMVSRVWDYTIHANLNWRLRFLKYLWVSPEYHHWHHSKEKEAWNKNYSGLLPIYDLIFGTFYLPKDKSPQHYGIPGGMSDDYIDQMLYPFQKHEITEEFISNGPVEGHK
ncbi:MAG: sterol desaturase family protein [Bacteroidetes bacterium]|nr:sterol desaturase family protein [Bacteroidota bacterium]